ncbi:MAG: nitrous oxide reductase family maturation protein NosD [Phycisphaerales bacterium]|nr:nitrous oxide reductase family maturation protein NosD [Phycisphaerales bacterium]
MRRRTVGILVCLLGVALAPAGEGTPESQARPVSDIVALIEAAPAGATVDVPPGLYRGSLRVRRPVVLLGHGQVTIDGGGQGNVVELLAPNITFQGFTVRGSGSGVDREPAGIRAETGPVIIAENRLEDVLFGIDLRTASNSVVRNNVVVGKDMDPGRRGDAICLWSSHECVVEGNRVRQARDMVFWYSENVDVRNNEVSDSRYGLHFMYSHNTTLRDNHVWGNSVGVYLMYSNAITLIENTMERNRGPSGYGIGIKECDDVEIRSNRIIANRVGVYVDNAPLSQGAFGRVHQNLIAYNEVGMLMAPSNHSQQTWNNGFIENEQQVATNGRGNLLANEFHVDGRGNYWSDYAGFDRAGDGRGDVAYVSQSLFEDLMAREPNLRLFMHSPAQQAIEFTARALPVMLPQPNFVDEHPLMTPPQVPGRTVSPGPTGRMGALCAGLLVAGALVMLAGTEPISRMQGARS